MNQKNESFNAFITRVNSELKRIEESNARIDRVEKIQNLINETFLPKFDNRPIIFESESAMETSDIIKKGDVCMVFYNRENADSYVKVYRIDDSNGEGTKIALKDPSLSAYPISVTNNGEQIMELEMVMQAIAELSMYISELEKKIK